MELPAGDSVVTGAIRSVGITIDGAGSAVTTGAKGTFRIPYSGTIIRAWLAETSATPIASSAQIDVLVNGSSICASAKPTLSNQTESTDETLTGWSKSIAAGNKIGFTVLSSSSGKRYILQLDIKT